MATMSCRSCGGDNDDRQDTCQHCGFPLPRQRAAPASDSATASQSTRDDASDSATASQSTRDDDPFAASSVVVSVRLGDRRLIELQPGDRLIVGRSPESPLSDVCGDNISFCHAEIYVDGASAHVVDTNSTNGTFVNGDRLAPRSPRALGAGSTAVRLAAEPPLEFVIEVRPVA